MKLSLKAILLIGLASLFINSCKKEHIFTDKDLAAAYEAVLKDKSKKNIDQVFNLANTKIATADKKEKLSIIQSMIKFTEAYKLKDQNLGFLKQAASIAPSAKSFKLISDKLKEKNAALADIYNSAIVLNFPESSEAKSLKNNVKSKEDIFKMINEIIGDTSVIGNNGKSENLMSFAEEFSIAFPKEKSNGDYLYKAGNTALSLNSKSKAFLFFDKLIDAYPNNANAPKALFIKAFIHDTDLKDISKAMEYYKQFLDKYPNHELAKDAKFLFENAGKDANEIMKQISK